MKAERLTETIAYHGEGPVWFPSLRRLRCVDMLHGAILTLDPADSGSGLIGRDRVERTPVGSPIASVLRPRVGGGAVIATESGISLARTDDLSDLTPAVELFRDERLRTNEGGCDPEGRFYVGTMAYDRTEGAASVYRWDGPGSEPRTVIAPVTTSNGIDWSPDGKRAYYNDTPTMTVWAFDHDPATGLGRRRPWVTIDEHAGRPDGLCVDAEGGVWVALNKGSAVHRYAPDGTLSEIIDVPVHQVTACTFGGADLDQLFITTSRENLEDHEEPAAGSVYVVRPGVRGLEARPFAG
ncbi:SMP-30/gluconolactonase/LRE family protein [Granulicoccus sp. GXG6511]|uniref:SMP-30/gluconolactonase/LRE family protein n=1 Tax=Granulicoccus sp. GXG6511 TaxID=3381351 RepID=UPI003D7EBA95